MPRDEALLSHEQTQDLLQKAKRGDADARQSLCIHNDALVRSVVKRFIGRGDYEDLYQLGCMGLVKAINNYDESYQVKFSTYAVPLILGEIRRYLRDDGALRVSRPLKELYARCMQQKEQMEKTTGREPSIEELSQALGCEKEDLVSALDACKMPISIYTPVTEEGNKELTILDGLEEADSVPASVDRVLLQQLLSYLSSRERQVIMMRYFMEKTQSEVAEKIGISQVQVSRMESKIIKNLRALLARQQESLPPQAK